jgi:hypothetical protein
MINITAEEKVIKEEIKRVRPLKTEGKWVSKHMRLPEQLFENDCTSEMEKISKGKKDKFTIHGINTILDMKLMTVSVKSAIFVDKGFRVSEASTNAWIHQT